MKVITNCVTLLLNICNEHRYFVTITYCDRLFSTKIFVTNFKVGVTKRLIFCNEKFSYQFLYTVTKVSSLLKIFVTKSLSSLQILIATGFPAQKLIVTKFIFLVTICYSNEYWSL